MARTTTQKISAAHAIVGEITATRSLTHRMTRTCGQFRNTLGPGSFRIVSKPQTTAVGERGGRRFRRLARYRHQHQPRRQSLARLSWSMMLVMQAIATLGMQF